MGKMFKKGSKAARQYAFDIYTDMYTYAWIAQ